MSKLAWERAVGTTAKLATVSVIAAFAATTSVAAESAAPANAQGAKVPASYGQTMAQPNWAQPAGYGQQFGGQQFGAPQFGAPSYAQPQFGAPQFGQPQFGAPQMPQQMIAPASTSSYAPAGAPKLPAGAAYAPHGQMPAHAAHGQMPAHPQFGQRLPIFANTQANGITYGPPSYTKPEGFDEKMASSSPFPSAWQQGNWQQQMQQMQQPAPMPNLAGAPAYGNAWGQQMSAASAGQYAPAEPSYAPAEPLRPNYSAAPAYAPAAQATYAPAAPATYESVDVTPAAPAAITPAPASTQTYSYEMAPATSAPSYVGQSTQIGSTYATAPAASANPYEVVIGQSGQVQQPTYQPAATAYQEAPAYEAAPAYQSQASAYEMTTEAAPAYPAATSYSTQGYESVTAAPAYEAAPAYQAAIPQNSYGSNSFASGNGHFVQVGAFRNPARAERLVRKLQGAGEQPIVTQATVRGKLYHRVRVPAMDKRDAKGVQSRIRGLGFYEARMVRG